VLPDLARLAALFAVVVSRSFKRGREERAKDVLLKVTFDRCRIGIIKHHDTHPFAARFKYLKANRACC
jgi:hypothetical protein